MPAKTVLDIDSLSNYDRVRGLSIHRTITAVGGIGGPIIAAIILTSFGGLDNVDSFRFLFLFQFAINVVIFLILWRKLDDVIFDREDDGAGVFQSFYSIFQGSSALKLFFVKDVIQSFFGLMVRPFLGIYQVDVKLVTAFIIGYMGAGEMLVDVFLSLPMGGVISRFGRRKIAYIGHLIGLLARCILFLTPTSHPEFLILYSLLGSVEGCMYLGWDAFTHEVVPQEVRGKYLGIRAVIVGVIGVFAPLLGGVIWNLNPDYLWWINALQWGLVAFPLMIVLMEKYSR
jgi:MFS family permease